LPLEAIAMTVASGVIGLGIGDTLYMIGLNSVGVARAVPLAAAYRFSASCGQRSCWVNP
jgi:hypothetical protein